MDCDGCGEYGEVEANLQRALPTAAHSLLDASRFRGHLVLDFTGFRLSGEVERAYIVLRSRGPAWDEEKSLEVQADWVDHAAFMDALFEER